MGRNDEKVKTTRSKVSDYGHEIALFVYIRAATRPVLFRALPYREILFCRFSGCSRLVAHDFSCRQPCAATSCSFASAKEIRSLLGSFPGASLSQSQDWISDIFSSQFILFCGHHFVCNPCACATRLSHRQSHPSQSCGLSLVSIGARAELSLTRAMYSCSSSRLKV